MSGPILALISLAGGVPDRGSLEALSVARGLAVAGDAALEAVLVADAPAARAAVGSLAGSGVTTAIAIEHETLTTDHPDGWAAAIAQLVERRAPDAVVGVGTERGNDLMARVGARLSWPMAANCLTVEPGERWRLTRQRWAGSMIEECWLDAPVRLLTVAPNTVAIPAPDGSAVPAVEPVSVTLVDADLAVHVTSREASERGGISLGDAKVVVGGGRGVGSGEGFSDLEELAGLLGGAVGGSRVVTSAGWRPHADQIGQTGLRIAPDIYIACGISGAIQHIVGCKAAKHILAINTDAEAPIMGVADYAVIGDLHTVVPAISAEIRRRAAVRA
ncbi:MAG TPA: electron transfer flavoprotein subunit alpha/FixB family protein [Candidatus Limnocylindrales bacterium]|nr:electron transfer flavoprotein subunit alpha/FixB family protein [Candidatus Limnocylindrales bacterium]